MLGVILGRNSLIWDTCLEGVQPNLQMFQVRLECDFNIPCIAQNALFYPMQELRPKSSEASMASLPLSTSIQLFHILGSEYPFPVSVARVGVFPTSRHFPDTSCPFYNSTPFWYYLPSDAIRLQYPGLSPTRLPFSQCRNQSQAQVVTWASDHLALDWRFQIPSALAFRLRV